MQKATAQASSDVALVKYWGKKDEVLRLPENGSLSMLLQGLDTITTVEFSPDYGNTVEIDGQLEEEEAQRVLKHLQRIKTLAIEKAVISAQQAEQLNVKVVSRNTFPKGTGLSSSGSGFAALTLAALAALGLELSEKERSILARQGSGTACRCMCSGFVEWKDGQTSDESYSESVYPPEYWDICDVIAVVDQGKKKISSTEGHQSAQSSPFYAARLRHMTQKMSDVKAALKEKDFTALGNLVEAEALEFHAILLTSTPSLIAWYPGTIEVMHAVRQMRAEKIEAYFTINTGFNVHVLTLPQYKRVVEERLRQLPLVQQVLHATAGSAPRIVEDHLF